MKGGPEKPPGSETAFLKGFWWTRGDSNPRPPRCERGALPAELLAHEQHVKFSKRLMPCQRAVFRGRAYSHHIPLARLKCVSPKRRLEMAARLGGEPGGARKLESSRHGYFRPLFRSGA